MLIKKPRIINQWNNHNDIMHEEILIDIVGKKECQRLINDPKVIKASYFYDGYTFYDMEAILDSIPERFFAVSYYDEDIVYIFEYDHA